MTIVFQKQINEDYSFAACIQMLTQTESSQQDIFFRTLRIVQSLKRDDYKSKAKFSTLEGPIVGQNEKICKLLEDSLNAFNTHDVFWKTEIGVLSERFPALILLHEKNIQVNRMLKGHPAIATKKENDKIEIYDPSNENSVFVSVTRLRPFISSVFSLSRVDITGNDIDF